MASYTLVHSIQSNKPRFAIVADDTVAGYVFTPGREMRGLDDKRIGRLLKARPSKAPVASEADWIRIAMTNVGYFYAGEPVAANSIDEARTAALEALGAAA